MKKKKKERARERERESVRARARAHRVRHSHRERGRARPRLSYREHAIFDKLMAGRRCAIRAIRVIFASIQCVRRQTSWTGRGPSSNAPLLARAHTIDCQKSDCNERPKKVGQKNCQFESNKCRTSWFGALSTIPMCARARERIAYLGYIR